MESHLRAERVLLLAATFAFLASAACDEKSAPWNTNPGVDGHLAFLPLRGTAHDPEGLASVTSCEGCHPGTSFREFVCTGCHTAAQTDPIHAGSNTVSGYVRGAVTSADCYRCHPDGAGIAPATHGLYFPIGTPAHPTSCTMCHTDAAARGDIRKLACVTCHERLSGFSTAHSRVRDYPLAVNAPWCLRCHADGQVDRIASHGPRTVRGGEGPCAPGDREPDGSTRHDTHCFTCHTMIPPDPNFAGTSAGVPNRPWAQDWRQAACISCHN